MNDKQNPAESPDVEQPVIPGEGKPSQAEGDDPDNPTDEV